MTLDERLRRCLQDTQRKQVLAEVEKWLRFNESEHRGYGAAIAAGTIRDLRMKELR